MASGSSLLNDGSRDNKKQRWTETQVYTRKSFNNRSKTLQPPPSQQTHNPSDTNSSLQQPRSDAVSDDSSAQFSNKVVINLASKPKHEMRELRKKLTDELDQVRSLVRKLEAKELGGGISHITHMGHGHGHGPVDNGGGGGPLHPLSVSVVENSQGGVSEVVEKEKRTPKVNKYYRNSDFISGKDKFPPPESSKKSKSGNSKKGGGGGNYGFGMEKSGLVYKECSALLEMLMKHVHGWVFNKPVDVKLLGLHDYYTIIKNPMDLGTVKTRLNKNWYKSPREFAEDVRLTFRNAMMYNPKGQDVHVMAEVLLQMFEEGWAGIEAEFNRNVRVERVEGDYDVGAPTPTSKRTPAPVPPPPFNEPKRTLDRSGSNVVPVDPKPKPSVSVPLGRIPAPKKPKAKEPNKRDMTYEEKQRLSTSLQSLPAEKLDNIVQIIKKRNSSLCQRDDEIEVDIDIVDAETLWELDRFVTNYKKSLSKNKKKAELAMQVMQTREPQENPQEVANPQEIVNPQEMNNTPAVVEAPKETKIDEKNVPSSSPVQREKQGGNASRSSSSSSSSSDSGSSSSDSDSDSSSASEAAQT